MLNLFSLKEKKEEGGKGPATKKKASAAQLRITKVVDLLASNPLKHLVSRTLTNWNFPKPVKQNSLTRTISLVSSSSFIQTR